MATKSVLWTVSIFLGLLFAANGDKVAQKIYQQLSGVNPCVLLTNATHQIGCTSSMSGHVGVLHYIKSEADVDWIIQNGSHAPYVPLFRSDLFTLEIVDRLIQKEKINGALVIAVPSGKYRYTPKADSPDYECPKDNFGIYSGDEKYENCKEVKWNPKGTGMSFKYFDIPMFALNDEAEVDDLLKGVYIFRNGAKYTGYYDQGLKNGDGLLEYPDGSKYEGKWKKNKRNGQGVYHYANGDIYDGEWQNNWREGKGVYTCAATKLKYDGHWVNGKLHGPVNMILANHVYLGHFMENRPSGPGRYVFDFGVEQHGKYVFPKKVNPHGEMYVDPHGEMPVREDPVWRCEPDLHPLGS